MRPEYPFIDANTQSASDSGWVKVVDGRDNVPTQARTALIGRVDCSYDTWDGQALGDVELDIRLRCDTHEVRRLVALPDFGSIELGVAAYSSITVFARATGNVSTSLPPSQVTATLRVTYSEEPPNPSRRNFGLWAWQASSTTTSQIFAVPEGARRMWPTVADPSFTWRLGGSITTIPVPQALTALQEYSVIGTRFSSGLQNQVLIWEIEV